MDARVVIPTRNGAARLPELLARLKSQKPSGLLAEIVVIDSASKDGTPQLARDAGATVISIAREEFNHGWTRVRATEGAKTGALVFLVQDALPADERFLAELLAPFEEPEVAGVSARVVPEPGASALVRRDVERDLVAGRARLRKRMPSLEEYHRWPPAERRILCHFNNVASAIRTSVFHALPFPWAPFGEDLAWGMRAIEAGHTIAFAPDAVVVHSHESGWLRDYLRHRDDGEIERRLFGIDRPRSFVGALARAARLTARDLAARPRVFAPALRLAQALGRWRGVRKVELEPKRVFPPGYRGSQDG